MRKIALFTISLLLPFSLCAQKKEAQEESQRSTPYVAKDYSHLFGMSGFSDSLLKMHFQLYAGYVKNTNLLIDTLRDWSLQGQARRYEYSALKMRFGWEFDGMRLHEFYFENLGGNGAADEHSPLYLKLLKEFGSFAQWKTDFIALGLTRGIGWVILYRDPQSGRLFNTWINEHDVGHLAGGSPILVMDVFEHAYITQYGLDREKYINAFFENIDWSELVKRYNAAEK